MSTPRKSKQFLSIKQKVEIVELISKGDLELKKISEIYDVHPSVISRIRKNKNNIMEYYHKVVTGDGNLEKKSTKESYHPQIDNALYLWYKQKRTLGEPISGPLLKRKALFFAEETGTTTVFKASDGWLQNFLKRHNIKSLAGQVILPTDTQVAEQFKCKLGDAIKENNYSLDCIYNCDETGLYWKDLPINNMAAYGSNDKSKEKITILFCCNASGTHKLTPLVIGTSKDPRFIKNINKYLSINYKYQKDCCVSYEIIFDWFKNQFVPSIGEKNVLLIMDNIPPHILPSATLDEMYSNVNVMYLPTNVTCLKQPLEQTIIPIFKRIYRKNLLRQLLLKDDNESLANFLKEIDLRCAFDLIHESWASISAQCIQACWKDLLSNYITITTNTKIEIPSVYDLLEMMPPCLSADSVTLMNWVRSDENESGYKILTDKEIVQELNEEKMDDQSDSDSYNNSDSESNSDDNNEDNESPIPTTKEAAKCMLSVIKYCENQADFKPKQLFLLHRLKSKIFKKLTN